MKIAMIKSGGQSGADRAGLDAAIEMGVPHGGLCPKGRKAEDGPIDKKYLLEEDTSSSYLPRTEKNVKNTDVTLIFVYGKATGGSARTVGFCKQHDKDYLVVDLDMSDPIQFFVDQLADFLEDKGDYLAINIAGSRESKSPGIWEITCSIVKGLLIEVNGP